MERIWKVSQFSLNSLKVIIYLSRHIRIDVSSMARTRPAATAKRDEVLTMRYSPMLNPRLVRSSFRAWNTCTIASSDSTVTFESRDKPMMAWPRCWRSSGVSTHNDFNWLAANYRKLESRIVYGNSGLPTFFRFEIFQRQEADPTTEVFNVCIG